MKRIYKSLKELGEYLNVPYQTIKENWKEIMKDDSCSKYARKVGRSWNIKREILYCGNFRKFIHPYWLKIEEELVSLKSQLEKFKSHYYSWNIKDLEKELEFVESHSKELNQVNWDLYGTLNHPPFPFRSKDSFDKIFEELDGYLKRKLPDDEIKLFYTTEENRNSVGFHHHFLINVKNNKSLSKVKSSIEGYLREETKGKTEVKAVWYVPGIVRYYLKDIYKNKTNWFFFKSVDIEKVTAFPSAA